MNIVKKVYRSSNFWPIIIVLVFALLAGKGLIGPGYFNMHDDLQMMRQLEMEKCFSSLQIPCRWVPDMGYGFGFPLFNYYPPLPYLFGEIFRIFGMTFVDTVKLVFISAFIFSGISMYFFAKEFFGKWGGVISSIFYLWAPYHSVDVYVRGAMNEDWALIFFPLILLLGYKLIKSKKQDTKYIIYISLSWTGLLLSHNLMAMIFAPIFMGWCLIWIMKERNFISNIIKLAIAGIISLGLAAFFTLPVTLEQGLVHTETLVQGYYEYTAHFATIGQLLKSKFWGYGPSVWGPNDGMSFQVGWLHWITPIIITALGFLYFLRKRKIENWLLVIGYFFLVGWFAVFMTHNKSTPIWSHIPPLRFVQFPWRFLTIVILSFSFVAGGLVKLIPKKYFNIINILLIAGVLIYSWNYFLPEHGKLGALTDNEKFTGAAWDLQQTAGIYDYLPVTAKTAPKAPMKNFVEIMEGRGTTSDIKLGTNENTFNINVAKEAVVRLGLFQFSNWKVFIDGKEIKSFIPETEEWGRMYINIPKGQHSVKIRLYNTPIRTIGNSISLISWTSLLIFLFSRRKRSLSLRDNYKTSAV